MIQGGSAPCKIAENLRQKYDTFDVGKMTLNFDGFQLKIILNMDEVVDLSTAVFIISDVVVVNIRGNPRKIMDVAKKNMTGFVGLYAEK